MKYGMFLYKAKATDKGGVILNAINRAVSKNSNAEWEREHADFRMLHFEADRIKDEILSKLTIEGNQLCKVEIRYSPQNMVEYLYIVTSYEKAKCVLRMLTIIAMEYELVLYDAEMDRGFLTNDIYCDSYVTMRLRSQQLNNLILKTQKPLWRLRKLDITNGTYIKSSSYVLTLSRDSNPFEDRIRCFYDLLRSNLFDSEELSTEYGCFTIYGNGYVITYCIEGYKKNADRLGFIENGEAIATLMKRMPCEIAIKQCESFAKWKVRDVYNRMRFTEWINKYPNPAERFVASVNFAKQLRKEKFDMAVSAIGTYGSEVLFHVVASEYSMLDYHQISVLKLEEDSASYILPIVESVYPYIYLRYYLTRNHLPREMMLDVLEKIKEARNMLINNTYDEKFKSLSSRFELYLFASKSEKNETGFFNAEDTDMIKNDRPAFINKHRYEIAHLYDMFISWVEDQLECYEGDDDIMFNIQGP